MAQQGVCNICGKLAEYGLDSAFPARRCPRCGDFDYDASIGWRNITAPDEMVRLSGWVREQNAAGVVPVRITPEISRRVTQMQLPGLRERSSRVLAILARDYWRPGAWLGSETVAHDPELPAVSYSRDEHEVLLLLNVLEDEGFLRGKGAMAAISVKGLLAAEALGASKSSSAQGFVAMWFNDSLRDAWTNGS
jgi:hypothetical protein